MFLFRTTFKIYKASDPAQLLSLNCFVLGDQPDQTFPVEIPKTKNIGILKDLIKEKKAHCLKHVDASDLILSQVSLTVDGLEESLKSVELTPLNPVLSLSQVFPHIERIGCTSSFKHHPLSLFRLFFMSQDIRYCSEGLGPRTRKKRRETRSLLWIKVRIFLPFLAIPN